MIAVPVVEAIVIPQINVATAARAVPYENKIDNESKYSDADSESDADSDSEASSGNDSDSSDSENEDQQERAHRTNRTVAIARQVTVDTFIEQCIAYHGTFCR